MPALQVRDFPATLYGELREYAASNHRSIAQQTIIAVEEMLAVPSSAEAARQEAGHLSPEDDRQHACTFGGNGAIPRYESYATRESRKSKRYVLFKELDSIPWENENLSTEDIVKFTRESREELSDRGWQTTDFIPQENYPLEGTSR